MAQHPLTCDYLGTTPGPGLRGDRRWRIVRVGLMIVLVGLIACWVWGYSVQAEVRWVRSGVHRHVESANGYVTVVITTGGISSDYWSWSTSPDLSSGRDVEWYKVNPLGGTRWYVRLHYVWPTFTLFLLVSATFKRSRLKGMTPAEPAGVTIDANDAEVADASDAAPAQGDTPTLRGSP